MEPLSQMKELKEKKYLHFTIGDNYGEANTQIRGVEFFYVGRNHHSIDFLIKTFEAGYAADHVEQAMGMMTQILSLGNVLPSTVIVDASIDTMELQRLHFFLAQQKAATRVPFLVDATQAHPAQIAKVKKLSFVDEILYLNDYDRNSLRSKLSFQIKIKQKVQEEIHEQRIETSGQEICTTKCIAKRTFDIVISSLILLVLSPILLLIAMAIKIESRGPVLYVSPRAGRGYRIFDFFKFRTMYTGADLKRQEFMHMNQYNTTDSAAGPVFFKIDNDPRITKVGLFLRKTSLDELPQLVNVLKGDMSLVGNRPLPLYEAATLTTDEWAMRFMAPAGITGLWQIKKRGQSDMSVEERLSLDNDYAEKYNFMYDLWIMANTPSALLQKSNA
jgi:lipopolysaccharide/colanic/teichoic acid biosynthesis glycosyltransferase